LQSSLCDYTLDQASITDQSGYFTITSELALGVYAWRVKNPQTLANAGTTTLVSGTNTIEMGALSEGDSNNDNCTNALDFSIMKITFDKTLGDPLYDARADFNGDNTISI